MNTALSRLARAALLALALGACKGERGGAEVELTTRIEALVPALAEAEPMRGPCPEVERQARELGAALPRQLDADTLATAVSAKGCDLTLEYQLITLESTEVSERGLRAMRANVSDELCADRGALGVMQRGGRFTSIYYDKAHHPIALFTVAADDCGI